MNRKKTGLAAFVQNKSVSKPEDGKYGDTKKAARKKRGDGPTVAITVRLLRDDWERLHQLAVSEGSSFQALALRGFSAVLREKGLPSI